MVLEDGAVFPGLSFGAPQPSAGEVVFTTGMVGYPEALSDPSYRGQILVFTYPSLGNYGVPIAPAGLPDEGIGPGTSGAIPDRPWESSRIQVSGMVCASYSEDYSHYSARQSLGGWLASQRIPGVTGVDTRALTKRIRVHGALLGRIEIEGHPVPEFVDPNARNLVDEVAIDRPRCFGTGGTPVLLIDCGTKNNHKGWRDLKVDPYDRYVRSPSGMSTGLKVDEFGGLAPAPRPSREGAGRRSGAAPPGGQAIFA